MDRFPPVICLWLPCGTSTLGGDHTVLLCTHILQEVEMVCKNVIIVGRGKVLAQGTPEELKNRAGGATRVEVRGPSDQVRSALSALAGVERVDTLPAISGSGVGVFSVRGHSGTELREQIAATVAQRGWSLRELRAEGASLEEFFVNITDPGAMAA